MSDKINSVKEKLINDYIRKIDTAVEIYNSAIETDGEIFDLIIKIANVFEKDIPNLPGSLLLRTGTELRDASTTRRNLHDKSLIHLPRQKSDEKFIDVEITRDCRCDSLFFTTNVLLFTE